jgi:splicing factor 3A subunit 1
MDKVAKGEIDDDSVQKDKQGDKEERKEPVDVGVEPPVAEFILNLPNITSIDL